MSWGEPPAPDAGSQGGSDWGQAPPPEWGQAPPDWGQAPPDNRLRQMDLGDVLDGTFRLVRDHWRAFTLGLGAVTVIPGALFLLLLGVWAYRFAIRTQNILGSGLVTDADLSGLAEVGPAFAELGAFVLVMFLGMLLVIPLIYGVPVHIAAVGYRTGRASAMDGIRAALRRYWGLLGTLVLLGLILFGIILVIAVPLIVVAGLAADSDAGGLFALVVLGYIAAWVVAVFAGIRMSLAIPAVMVERAGPVEAVKRSNALVKGKTLSVFATFLVVSIIAAIAVFVLMFGSSALINTITVATDSMVAAAVGGIVVLVITMFAYLMQYALMAATVVLVYFDRRVRTEGLDLAELANELDVRPASGW